MPPHRGGQLRSLEASFSRWKRTASRSGGARDCGCTLGDRPPTDGPPTDRPPPLGDTELGESCLCSSELRVSISERCISLCELSGETSRLSARGVRLTRRLARRTLRCGERLRRLNRRRCRRRLREDRNEASAVMYRSTGDGQVAQMANPRLDSFVRTRGLGVRIRGL